MRLYLAGPMRGIKSFNFPAFAEYAALLRAAGHIVFSPSEKDIERLGVDISKDNLTGSHEQAKKHGFSLRDALAEDMEYICKHAEGIALIPGWQKSTGATAERATGIALGHTIIELPEERTQEAVVQAVAKAVIERADKGK